MSNSQSKFIVEPEQAKRTVRPVIEEVYQRLRQARRPVIPGAMRNLENWMLRLAQGNAVDDRPPIWKDEPRTRVKSRLDHIVEAHVDKVNQLDTRLPGAGKFWFTVESDQAKALGPSSMFPAFKFNGASKIEAVYSDKPLDQLHINERASRLALEHMRRLLPRRSLRAVALKSVRPGDERNASRSRLDGSTNSGEPAWISGWWKLSRDDAAHKMYRAWLEETVTKYVAAVQRATKFDQVIPDFLATAGIRTVSKGPDPLKPVDGKWKNPRFVIAMPKTETWPGKTIFVPEQAALLTVKNEDCPLRCFAGWLKMPSLDKNMQILLEYAASKKLPVISGDLSSFDATVPPAKWWELKLATAEWFDDYAAKLYLALGFADIYRTALITPEKVYDAQPSSVKSGSIFTNVDDSLFNLYVQWYGYFSDYYGKPVSAVNGDDIVMVAPGDAFKGLQQAFADHGMVMNGEKSLLEYNMLHFLQRTHYLGIPGGMGSIYRTLVKCLAVEDESQLKYDEHMRWAYIVQALFRIENACFNPMFKEFVELMAAGDRYQLGRHMSIGQLTHNAGEYVERKLASEAKAVWSSLGSGVPFARFAVNRVLRGEILPPPGLELFKNIYGIQYSSVPV